MARQNKQKVIKAVQLVYIPHPEGVTFAVLSDEGVVYVRTDTGWLAMDMQEAPHDSTV